ncbi:hypothetical protein [Variovorax rhizosphaerae]|uniref:DUF2937 family protein n=1 Tax=Variovorax rhizosphaerae TaxID=1836200 RepID=A0ABU8WHL9_9BURK
MAELPTDKLCKFFAVGGIVIAVLGGTVAVERFHQAELRRIDADEKANAAKAAYARLSAAIDRQVDLSKSVRAEANATKRAALLADFWKLNDETKLLMPAVDTAIVELKKHGDLNKHFAFMRTLWMYIGGVCVVLGTIASGLGFRSWRKQESQPRKMAGSQK